VPVQVAAPQRQIQPITFALGQPDGKDGQTSDADASQSNVFQDVVLRENAAKDALSAQAATLVSAAPVSLPAPVGLPEVPANTPKRGTARPAGDRDPARQSNLTAADAATVNDAGLAAKDLTLPGRTEPNLTEKAQPAAASSARAASPNAGPPAELKIPELTPLEPAPTTAAQKVVEDASSSPSALAFAARVTAVTPNKSNAAGLDNPLPPAAGSSDTTASTTATARIPMRYAATAQVISKVEQKFALKPEGDLDTVVDPTKNAGPAFDRAARPDLAVPGDATPNQPLAGNPQTSPAPEPAPTARMEHVIEPPAAPPTSPNDIRVRVPDNNGGSTQVRFLESNGEVKVSVRTTDAGLAQNLRSHLSDLSQRLADGGVQAEIWKPAADAASSQNDSHHSDRQGGGSGGQNSGSNSGKQGNSQDSQQERPAWLEEMEASLHGGGA
jgi:hypothetical protein